MVESLLFCRVLTVTDHSKSITLRGYKFHEKICFLPIALDSCLIKLALALFRVQIRGASGAANLGSGFPKLKNSVVSRR